MFATGGKLNIQPDLQFRRSGSAALDIAYVAAGRYDGYFQHNLNLWDIAAGIILTKEAGGVINEINLAKTKNIDVIASTVDIRNKMLEKIHNFNCFKKSFAISLDMKNIHPSYHVIKVEMMMAQFETRSTWGAVGDILKLEIDPKSHSAWTGGKQKLMDKGRISKFNKKFQNFKSEKEN